ncbi:hypothetical protein [Glaciecola sp. MF2-115]|uniref:hypothetical protein n=1 Tax=Glaciecola sp. MF2-115 TaxID=3384827 RepID=UPI0039A27C67
MLCQKCGKKNNTEELLCPSCGSISNTKNEKNKTKAAHHNSTDNIETSHCVETPPPVTTMPPPLPKITEMSSTATLSETQTPVPEPPELTAPIQLTSVDASQIQTSTENRSQESAQPIQPPPLKITTKTKAQTNVKPKFKKVNSKLLISFYLISVLGTLGAFVSGQLTAIFDPSGELFAVESMLFTIIYFLFYMATIVIFCISLYRAWEVLQNTTARTSSGLAVGLLFVPVFNVYWVFQSLWGWSKDYQLFTTYHEKGTMPYVNKQIFLAQCVLLPMLAIPIVNSVITYFIVPTTLIIIFQMSKATNFIIDNNLVENTEVNT